MKTTEVKKLKTEAENQIKDIIKKFEDSSGLNIYEMVWKRKSLLDENLKHTSFFKLLLF